MSTTEQPLGPGLESDEGAGGEGTPGLSVLEHVQRQKAQIIEREREPKIFKVPEWGGALAIKYDYPEEGATPIIRAGMRMQGLRAERAVDAALDVILGACVEVMGRRSEDEEWQPLVEGRTLKIGTPLADALQIEVPSGVKRPNRFIARNLFSPKAATDGQYTGDLALVEQAGDVTEWLRGIEAESEAELEGE